MSEPRDSLPVSHSGRPAMDVVTQAIKEAGRTVMKHFLVEKKVHMKGRGNVVTSVDYLVESSLTEALRREFPSFGLLCEESVNEEGTSGYTWIIDPLDGTRNYASGLPHFCVAVALVRGEDILLGLVYDPVRNELFHAEKGEGAYLNGAPIRVSRQPSVEMAVVGLDMGYDDVKARRALELITALWPGMQSVRIMGSAALGLAYAAAGRLDIYIHHFLYPWDIASGILLVQEAGGKVTDRLGQPVSWRSQGVIAAGEAVYQDFIKRTAGFPWRAK